jgi:hypothetical protein
MKNIKTTFITISAGIIFFSGCKNQTSRNDTFELSDDTIIKEEVATPKVDTAQLNFDHTMGIPIYYNMYLTVELSSLFEAEGAYYEPTLLNPEENVTAYLTSSERALNLGVYAVDLSYARVFEQYQKAGSYFSAMYELARELGIPEEFIHSSAERMDRNLSNKDSLRAIANEVYYATDKYLKKNERGHASALIVTGGWIEAMYLASEIFELDQQEADLEYMTRLEEQKISLDNLIELLSVYKADAVVFEILTELKQLKPLFDDFVVYEEDLSKSIPALNKVNTKVKEIRSKITS